MGIQTQKCKDAAISVKYDRCDNSEENKSLETLADKSNLKLGIDIYYTACDTPYQNYPDEMGFATIDKG